MTTLTQPLSLNVSRLIKAPRERVFAAWTNANELSQWLGCGERTVLSSSIDLRVGGEYLIKSSTPDKGEQVMSGIYREIKAPERLVFTWTMGGCIPEMKGLESIVTVELKSQAGGTMVNLTHEGFPNDEIRDLHNTGWNFCFDTLEKLV